MGVRVMVGRRFTQAFGASLMGGASFLALAGSAQAQTVLFSSNDAIRKGPLEAGREQVVTSGTVQIKLASGAVASFVNSAQFSVRDDGGIDLRSGSVTVVGTGGAVAVHMPEGVKGTLQGAGTASFSVGATGSRGSTTAGNVAITANGVTNVYAAGQFWSAAAGKAPDRVVAGAVAAVPDAGSVLPMREGGAAAVAANGLPIALGEALAGAGASGDLVAAARRVEAYDANPAVGAFPSGDYAALIGYAAAATSPLGAGGRAFNGAQADIIRTYFEYLAAGNAGANFRTAYAAVLVNYLDLVRSGVLPSSFRGATQAQLNAYIAFIGRTDGFGGLTPANRQLLDAYLAFLSTNGTPDQFGTSVTNLTTAFLNYVRGGGDPAAFTQASASVVAQYLAIVNSGGLKTNLNAQNQALLAAYLANNDVAFSNSYATGLAQFVAYLNTGGLPSNYTAVPAATLRNYLETLETTGLFDRLLGAQAAFLRSYLGFLRTGGTPDQFNALPINVARVNAAALSAYVDYLLAGGAPTAYSELTQAQIRAALDQLTAVGQFNVLLGANSGFLGEYYAYIATGADPDAFAGLPTVDVNAYAAVLSSFAAYLRAGNLPSNYSTLTAQQVRSYLTALQFSGNIALLGGNATLLGDYLAYLRSGGAPDNFTGLPIYAYQGYASALAAYFAYLNAGGLPSGYSVLTQAQLRDYLAALQANGQFTLLGANSGFYTDYLAYLTGGGTVDGFNGLPIVTYQGYASALAAYFAYLNAGGLPSGYSVLSQVQIRAYLDALSANTTLSALLGANAQFFAAYRTYLAGGGTADGYTGLPIVAYQGYASALSAYYAFLLGGGTPSAYTALTQAQIRAYLDALSTNSTLTALLGANATFFQAYYAYLAGGGGADAYAGLPSATYGQYAAALNAYFAYLTAGNLPSGYTALTAQQIQQYLNVLQANGQLAALLGANATFYSNYLAFITGGGSPDAFTGLPIVTYQGYAAALSAYYAYLAGGGLPANYTVLTQAQIRTYLDALNAAGQITALLGANATFFSNYLAYIAGGGNPANYTQLPANIYAGYGSALVNFVAYLRGNGLPASYSTLTSTQIREYLAVLTANGQLSLIGSQSDIALLNAYASFLAGGGVPNQFPGLPAFVTYEAALRTYYAYLQGGGLPSNYATLTQQQIVAYIQALDAAGLITTNLTAQEAQFVRDYAAWVAAGNNPNQFAGLPSVPTVPVVTQGLAGAPVGQGYGTSTLAQGAIGKGFTSAVNTDGAVTVSGNNLTAFSGAAIATAQTAATVEARTVDSTIAVARWGAGTWRGETGGDRTILANEGLHFVWGAPATAVPTSGTATYGLVTATSPTVDGGSVAPGSFTGNLGVDFATRRIGLDSRITMGGVVYGFSTAGGAASPALALVGAGTFNGVGTVAGNSSANGLVNGFLSGLNGAYAGLIYSAALPIGTVEGTAIFGRNQGPVTLPTITYTGPSSGGLTQTPFAYTAGLPTTLVRARTTYPASSNLSLTTYNGTTIQQSGGVGAVERIGVNSGSQEIVRGSARNADVAGDDRALVGRWTDGTYLRGSTTSTLGANQSLQYALLAPMNFTLPYFGRIDYTLLAATQPSYAGGQTGVGLFDARMAILLSSSPKVALQGSIQMPETSGTVTYNFTTPGGVANPDQAAAVGEINASGFSVTAALSGTGLACQSSSCTLRFEGGFGGSDPLRVGGVYYTGGTTASISGAAAFAGSWVGGAQSLTTVTTRNVNAIAPSAAGTLNVNQGSYDIDATGRVVGMTNFNGLYDRIGTAQIAETGSAAGGLIGWTRWTNGTLDIRRFGAASAVLGANQGYQIVHGAPATALPTSGTVNYALAGGSRPTDFANVNAPGELISGQAAVAFGSTTRVAFDLVARIGGNNYNLFTNGKIAGVASSEVTVASGGIINQVIGAGGNVTSTGSDCPATQCRAIWQGFLAGAGGTAIGLNYQMQNTVTQARFGGIAAFDKVASPGTAGVYSNQIAYAFGNGAIIETSNPAAAIYTTDAVTHYTPPSGGGYRTGVVQEGGRLSETIGWARWTGDTAGPLTNQGANQGVHVLAGTPTSNITTLPTGTIQYTLVGGTKPTLSNGSASPGTITGNLAVQFGSTPRVGFDLTASVGQYGWNLRTTGGAADPSQSQVSYGSALTFGTSLAKGAGVTGTTAASCTGTCTATINGQFFGTGVTHIGVGVNVFDGTLGASGVAIFAKP